MEPLRQQLRQHYRQYRRQLTQAEQQAATIQITQRLLAHPRLQQAEHIAVYLAFDGEISLSPLFSSLWQQGKKLYLPVLHPFCAGHLIFLQYTAESRLEKNQFAILQPVLDIRYLLPITRLDLLLIPLVAFDKQGQRLGMGGGFYDRTLQNWQHQRYYPLGIAHDGQYVEQLPTANWDVPLPEILTPSRQWLYACA